MRHRLAGLIALLALVAGCSSVEDTRPDPTELQSFDERAELDQIWSARTGGGADDRWIALRPTVTDDRVFTVGAAGKLRAHERDDGKRVWQARIDEFVSAGLGVDDDHVYLGTRAGRVIAFDRDDGERAWDRAMEGELLAAPATGEGLVVVRTVDGRVTALDPADGSRAWSYSASVPELTLRGIGRPVVVDGGVVVGLDDGRVVALEASSGEAFWETVVASPEGRTPIERMVDIDGSMGVGRRNLYAASYQGRVVQIGPAQGRINWGSDISSYAGLNVDRERVYVTDDADHVRALDTSDGEEVWQQEKLAWRGLTAPVPVPDTDWLVVADREGYVHLLERDSGEIVARARAAGRDAVLADPVVTADGRIHVQNRDSHITVYEARARD